MRKAIDLVKKDGIGPLFSVINMRLRSKLVQRWYGYPKGFLLGDDATWLTGKRAQIGENFRIGKRCRIEVIDNHNGHFYDSLLTIGNNVSMNDDVHIGCIERVTIGNNVLLASKIFISDHNHGRYAGEHGCAPSTPPGERPLFSSPVDIQDNVWIGEMVSILPGVTIGYGSVIGSNSVVSRSIPPQSIAVGAPARVVKSFDQNDQLWKDVK